MSITRPGRPRSPLGRKSGGTAGVSGAKGCSPPGSSSSRNANSNRHQASLLVNDGYSSFDGRKNRSGVAMDTIAELEKVGSWHTPQKMRLIPQSTASANHSRVSTHGQENRYIVHDQQRIDRNRSISPPSAPGPNLWIGAGEAAGGLQSGLSSKLMHTSSTSIKPLRLEPASQDASEVYRARSHAHGVADKDGNASHSDTAVVGAGGGGAAGKAQIAKMLSSGSGRAAGGARGVGNTLTSALTNYLNFASRSSCGASGQVTRKASEKEEEREKKKSQNKTNMRCCDSSFNF